ncbi:hypothetical protein RclHR1_01680026 [Rhizophagus clarus]|uniref:tyrosinase n=1 Tax=Rhizophagus clarus TaxID=94130 RepID=A0A2Z6QJV6_9GLOM|nr:hypothetical protein RclHR1_01680026 [Rhizophagus clarus]GES83775.1 polyphenol oxidase [Rhizophagus clarus]
MVKTYKKVVLRRDREPKPRLAVEVLMTDDDYKEQRYLFLRGFAAVQQKDPEDPTSFYRIASIHGLPYEPYDGVTGTYNADDNPNDQYGGYCHHGDILFPTWHRPYVLLLEQCIYDEAKKLVEADTKKDGYANDPRYVKALEDLRFPYWDWASPSTLAHGLPAFFSQETVRVALNNELDKNNKPKKYQKIPNPLRAYTLPKNLGTMSLVGDRGNPTQRPYVPNPGNPYTPEGYATVRHPSEDYLSRVDKTSLSVIQQCSTVFRPNIYQVFLVDDWRKFSNHGWLEDPDHKLENQYGHFASIEAVHDSVHLAVGGDGGHIANSDVAAFDPIFFLHHCNVDRFVAIWQAIHPDVWIEENDQTIGTFTTSPGVSINAETNLTPFRKTENEFLNSNDVRDIKKLGYTYSILEKGYTCEELLKSMLDYYHPNRYLETHWQVQIRVKKHYLGYPFTIRVFFDHPKATSSTSTSSPNYAGSMYVFARGKNTQCENCKRNPDMVVNGSVDLTLSMQRLDLLSNNELEIEGNRITLVAVTQDGAGISLDEIGLVSADIYRVDTDKENAAKFNYKFVNHVEIPGISSPSRS